MSKRVPQRGCDRSDEIGAIANVLLDVHSVCHKITVGALKNELNQIQEKPYTAPMIFNLNQTHSEANHRGPARRWLLMTFN